MQMHTGLSYMKFNVYNAPKTGKIGTFDINRDPLGTQLVKKVPIGTRVPKWGPTWKQWAWGGSNPC